MTYVDRPDTDEQGFDEAVGLVLDAIPEDETDPWGDEPWATARVMEMLDEESGSISAVIAKLRGEG